MKAFLIALALISAVVLVSPVSASAATNAGVKPGSFWYGFDIAFEKINMFFTFGSEGKARKALEYADERLAEAEVVAENNNTDAVKEAITNYESNIAFAAEKSKDVSEKKKSEALLTTISDSTSKHQEILTGVLNKVPDEAKEAIIKAIEASRRGHEEALQKIAELKDEVAQLEKEVAELKQADDEGQATEIERLRKENDELKKQQSEQKTVPKSAESNQKSQTQTVVPTPAKPPIVSTPKISIPLPTLSQITRLGQMCNASVDLQSVCAKAEFMPDYYTSLTFRAGVDKLVDQYMATQDWSARSAKGLQEADRLGWDTVTLTDKYTGQNHYYKKEGGIWVEKGSLAEIQTKTSCLLEPLPSDLIGAPPALQDQYRSVKCGTSFGSGYTYNPPTPLPSYTLPTTYFTQPGSNLNSYGGRIQFNRDLNGNIHSSSNGTNYFYDLNGRVDHAINSSGRSYQFNYDLNGNVDSINY